MKIAFRGFRGFDDKAQLIDINDLTINIGKNGSGKSTYIKLLQLLASSFIHINTIENLLNLKIEILNEKFGGKEKFLRKNYKELSVIFDTKLHFYSGNYFIKLLFKESENSIIINSIELYIEDFNKKENLIYILSSSIKTINLNYFYNKYCDDVVKYNSCMKYNAEIFFKLLNSKTKDSEFINKLYMDLIDSFDSSGMKEYFLHFMSSSDTKDMILFETENYVKSIFSHKTFSIENSLSIGPLNLNEFQQFRIYKPKEYIIEKKEIFDFLEHISTLDLYDFNSFKQNLIKNNSFDIFIDELHNLFHNHILNKYFFGVDGTTAEYYYDFDIVDWSLETKEFDKWSLVSDLILMYKSNIFPLAKITNHIVSNAILQFTHYISSIDYTSNISQNTPRFYNLFERDNNMSNFLLKYKNLNKKAKNELLAFLNSHIRTFELGESISIDIKENVAFINLDKFGNSIPLIDEGSGISNIIKLLLFLSINISKYGFKNDAINLSNTYPITSKLKRKILIIEEPETNLHPSLQSKLTNLFIDIAKNYSVTLIIETHSEYLIRKLQFLVAKGEFNPKNIGINYFEMVKEKKEIAIRIKHIPICENGTLESEFGTGFYDEANNLSIDLFRFNQSQDN